jgi:hypothetical protein
LSADKDFKVMELDGPITDNLRAAIASATRLRGHPVHKDTLLFWHELLSHAHAMQRRARVKEMEELEALIAELDACVTLHDASRPSRAKENAVPATTDIDRR